MVSILIPVYNEEQTLEHSVNELRQFMAATGLEYEVVITSNGSNDGTDEIGRKLQQSFGEVRFFTLSRKSVGEAFENNVRNARYEHLISIDADLSCDLAFIPQAVSLLSHCTMVVGTKTLGSQKRSLARIFFSQLYIVCTQLLFGLTISDFSMGVKAFNKSGIVPCLGHLDRWTGYILEICLYLKGRGQRMIQIGVSCDDRRRSRFNLMHEGVYRYMHLFRTWKALRDPASWLNTR